MLCCRIVDCIGEDTIGEGLGLPQGQSDIKNQGMFQVGLQCNRTLNRCITFPGGAYLVHRIWTVGRILRTGLISMDQMDLIGSLGKKLDL